MKRLLMVLVVVMLALGVGQAQAAAIIDFGGFGPAGTITVLPDGTVTGSGIAIQGMSVLGAPLNNGLWAVTNGSAGFGVLNFAYGPSANMVEVVGAVPGLGIGAVPLLTGTFNQFTWGVVGGQIDIDGGGPDTKARSLLLAIGLDPLTPFAVPFGFITRGNFAGSSTNGTAYTAFSTDIANHAVPEPGSMLLLGTGLFGLAGAVRRRLKK